MFDYMFHYEALKISSTTPSLLLLATKWELAMNTFPKHSLSGDYLHNNTCTQLTRD